MSELEFEKLYERLNTAQKRAVDTIDGPVLVVAGPGSGKTEILSLRVATILQKTDVYASNILCLTFTDAAAVNMRKRLSGIIGNEAYHVGIHTFHNFCVDVIERYPEYFYDGAFFEPADELVQMEILEEIFDEMPHDNPIASTHPDRGYIYLKYVKSAIEHLKKGGLTPEEFKAVLDHNESAIESIQSEIDELFSKRVSKSILEEVDEFIDSLTSVEVEDMPVSHLRAFHEALALSLSQALEHARDEDSTKPITEWKRKNTKKENNRRILKSAYYQEKMRALADVYEQYMQTMHKRGYFDYDDMLIDVIQAMRESATLKHEIQEQYQYILVDEFQDTNDAQMRLLLLLSNAESQEGRPNVMAVGDDDQAIYKFQGAEISNILNFQHRFRDPEVITMTDNYRSTQDVLNAAREIIQQGEERLENVMNEMEKDLRSANDEIDGGAIVKYAFPTRIHQYHGIAEDIRDLLDDGKDPEEIAVIGRRHSDLEELVPFLHEKNIPITYEKQQNVLEQQHIRQLIVMARFTASLARKNKEEADEYMPEILSFPFWELDRKIVWEISLAAHKEGKRWLEVMQEYDDQCVQDIAHFFLECAGRSLDEPVEYIIDAFVGAHLPQQPDGVNEDDAYEPEGTDSFVSPFKEYYFSKKEFKENTANYLRFLSSLKSFIRAIREYKSGSLIRLDDLISFVDVHKNNDILVTDTSPFVNAEEAIELMTAHKSKGQEFDTVFVLSCQEDIWAGRGRRNMLPFPPNLPLAPAGDTRDDQLRLFYVAITRAKRHLYLNWYRYDDDGSEVLPVEFLTDVDVEERSYASDEMPEVRTLLETTVPGYHKPPFVADEKALLKPLVEDYQLSVTHLNNFLDVTNGGPQTFLENNLLRFPQPMPVAALYGAVMHTTLRRIYLELKKNDTLPSTETVGEWFEEELKKKRLSERDFKHFRDRGIDAIERFYEEKKDTFDASHNVEFNFRQEGVRVSDAELTGKIDKMVPVSDSEIRVHDYKTGKAAKKWSDRVVKLWKYKNQLVFYKLLVENSRTFTDDYIVRKGVLEFVEPDDDEVIDLPLTIDDEDVERLSKLIIAVHEKIANLTFPDVSDYENSIDGIYAFESDLIEE